MGTFLVLLSQYLKGKSSIENGGPRTRLKKQKINRKRKGKNQSKKKRKKINRKRKGEKSIEKQKVKKSIENER